MCSTEMLDSDGNGQQVERAGHGMYLEKPGQFPHPKTVGTLHLEDVAGQERPKYLRLMKPAYKVQRCSNGIVGTEGAYGYSHMGIVFKVDGGVGYT